jgi:hypothetical protein
VCPIKVLLNEESHSLILWFLLPDAKRKPDDMGKIRKNHPQNIERNYFGYNALGQYIKFNKGSEWQTTTIPGFVKLKMEIFNF